MKKNRARMNAIILLFGILICTLTGCQGIYRGTNNDTSKPQTIEDKVSARIERYVETRVRLEYECKTVTVQVTSITIKDDEATVYGVATVRDNYNDTYKGKFNGTVEFSVEDDEIKTMDTSKIEIGKFYKER